MKIKPSTEHVLLGALMTGPKHGYEIMQFLGSALEATWRVGTSQLYALLKRLEEAGLLCSTVETQGTRPSKRVFALTRKGKSAFLYWLHSPVGHVRDFRLEFIGKLFFFHHLSLDGGSELVSAQIRVLTEMRDKLLKRSEEKKDGFEKLVYGFKKGTVEGLITWLSKEARPFMERLERKPVGGGPA